MNTIELDEEQWQQIVDNLRTEAASFLFYWANTGLISVGTLLAVNRELATGPTDNARFQKTVTLVDEMARAAVGTEGGSVCVWDAASATWTLPDANRKILTDVLDSKKRSVKSKLPGLVDFGAPNQDQIGTMQGIPLPGHEDK